MSDPNTEEIKRKIQKYGPFLAYTGLGLAATGFFAFKIASTRLENMKKIKVKSKVPIMHKNMKNIAIAGVIGAVVYCYGFYQIIRRIPQGQSTMMEIKDETFLADWKRKDPELQDIYIIKSMKMFGVSPELIEKTRQQFRQMGPQRKSEQRTPSFNFQLLKTLLQRLKIQKQLGGSETQNKVKQK